VKSFKEYYLDEKRRRAKKKKKKTSIQPAYLLSYGWPTGPEAGEGGE
jgi:hypothetical protein